ncbi:MULTISPECIES: lytic transglycosylase domain-containing protein [Cetobacterium]|jgi:soluble lytic murein transglycosylase-like protein|uniref:Lytic transglycosylase domain-containing protein n=1 Tax=Candidatus Cetobacterium colombiensis TaxID=3073100 RepID=A0ABU4WFC1_9FUSO|nr:lytic transglycosylase domain-containing protein [Candidatus Cetobacterium colombiensis]MDX8337090.1 lytic transglycosylase domain-containing protein [Candidatus Cetobacterium colombiensis]
MRYIKKIAFLFSLIFSTVFSNDELLENYILKNISNLENARFIYEDIIRFSSKYEIDPALVVSIIKVESSFNHSAVSEKGAIGLMQLMPETADELQVDPFNVSANIEGGIKYFSRCLKLNNNDIALALASYNAGHSNVQKYESIPPFSETDNYISEVLKVYTGSFNKRYVFNPVSFEESSFKFGEKDGNR